MGRPWIPVVLLVVELVLAVDGFVFSKSYSELMLRKQKLQFGNGKAFKIAIMADLHYGENAWTDWGPEQDVKSTYVQEHILDTENPDFVIYLGDQVTANNILAANSSNYWRQAINPAIKRSIPHASVFGNHDDAFMEYEQSWFGPSGIPGLPSEGVGYYHASTREDLAKSELEIRTSLTQAGPNTLWPSLSNYALPVASATSPSSVAVILYFLDSGGGSYPELISASQAAWFKTEAHDMNPSGSIPELVFFHIPTKTHQKIGPKPTTIICSPCVGSINLERVSPQIIEKGAIDILLERQSVKAVFSGHNHGLDWCCPHHHLWLCFARHTGHGGYGNWTRGSRILEIIEQPSFQLKSWIRLENGYVVAEASLT